MRWFIGCVLLLWATGVQAQGSWNPATAGARVPYVRASALDLADYCDGSDTDDDTACMRTWISEAQVLQRHLFASPGTYYYTKGSTLFQGFQLQCATPIRTVFKARQNAHDLFVLHPQWGPEPASGWQDIRIENCGFDQNGSTADFGAVIALAGGTQPVSHVTIRGNLVWDSMQPHQMSEHRDQQRQYIVIMHATDVLVEGNHLAEGGRIKVGRPGQRVLIQRNTLHNINDNAITVVDQFSGLSADILVAHNTITNPLGSGVFFGTDGQSGGTAALQLRDVTVRENIIAGTWVTNCISGVLPNHTTRVLIEDNTCYKTGPTASDTFVGGVALSRNNTSTRPATDVTVRTNHISSELPNALERMAGIFITDLFHRVCILGNTVRDTHTAVWLRSGMSDVTLLGNDVGQGTVRLGPEITLDPQPDPDACWYGRF